MPESPEELVQHEFWKAQASGNFCRVRDLIEAGADVNLPIGNPGGETPLIRAVSSGDLQLVQLLLRSGADPNLAWTGPRCWTPLMFAHTNPAMIRELLAAGANIKARTAPYWIRSPSGSMKQVPGGETALHLAAAAGEVESVRLLVAAGAEIEARADNSSAPLDYALRLGSINEAAEALVEAGANLTPERLEQMHAAAHRPDSDILAFPFGLQAGAGGTGSDPVRERKSFENTVHTPAPAPPQGPPNEFKCPKCHGLIYSRKPKLCGQCGALLPPELLLSEHQAEARQEERKWARDLADKFTSIGCGDRMSSLTASAGSSSPTCAPQATPTEILRRVSCAEEFRHRDRPSFWLLAAAYGLILSVLGFWLLKLGLPITVLALLMIPSIFACIRAWVHASPLCPNCHRNIATCAPAFCHACGNESCGAPCGTCAVDSRGNWKSYLGREAAGNSRRITYCPGCGVRLDTILSR